MTLRNSAIFVNLHIDAEAPGIWFSFVVTIIIPLINLTSF